ncbi:MAG: thioredoxin family protein [Phycisphaerales bacterium JB065]
MPLDRSDDSRLARLPIALTRTGAILLCAGGLLTASPSIVNGAKLPDASQIADDAKSVFYDGTHDEALAEVKNTDQVVVLYFTASWCGPCQRMQRTTWVDERVVEKLTTDALVVKIDVDEQEELAKRYRIQAMPTMLALRGDKEVNRVVGLHTPEQLLGWIDKVERLEPGEIVQPEPVAENDADARYERAKLFLVNGRFEAALEDYEWLWDNIPSAAPNMIGVRGSFMAGDIGKLCTQHAPAHAAFTRRRDESFAKLGQPEWRPLDVSDFVTLNEALNEQDETMKWYEMLKDDPANERMLGFASSTLVPMLIEHARYAEAGRLIKKPIRSAEMVFTRSVSSIKSLQDRHGLEPELMESLLRDTATRKSQEVAALFAASRDDEATRVAAIIVKELGTLGREVLARTALNAGVVRPLHLTLLRAIEEADRPVGYDELVRKVSEAISNQNG